MRIDRAGPPAARRAPAGGVRPRPRPADDLRPSSAAAPLRGLERTGGHGRSPPRQRPAELHAGRPGRHRGQGVARARPRGAADERPRVPAQQARHRQPRAGRPAQGIGSLRPADRARHPRRSRPDRRGRGSTRYEFAGELSLGGELRPVHGALAMALALQRRAGDDAAHARPAAGERRRVGARRRPRGARRRSPARRRPRLPARRRRRRERAARASPAAAPRAAGAPRSRRRARPERRQARARGRRGRAATAC